jgi:hypothetical protein
VEKKLERFFHSQRNGLTLLENDCLSNSIL